MNKKSLLLSICLTLIFTAKAHALAVIDASNLAQNVIAAQENMAQSLRQIEELRTKLNQYQRMLKDAMNPGSFEWGDIQNTINQLRSTMNSIKGLGEGAGGLANFLGTFGSYETYESMEYGSGSTQMYKGRYDGSIMEKQASDELLKLVQAQQEELAAFSAELEALKSKSAAADGQQMAIQAGNEFASKQVEALTNIQALLAAQNVLLAAMSERANDERSQRAFGDAISTGKTGMIERESDPGSVMKFGVDSLPDFE